MANDLQKYIAQIFQINGFALMSAIGKFILDLKDTKFENNVFSNLQKIFRTRNQRKRKLTLFPWHNYISYPN